MPDVHYSFAGSAEGATGCNVICQTSDGGGGSAATATNKAVGSCQIYASSTGTVTDFADISVVFFR